MKEDMHKRFRRLAEGKYEGYVLVTCCKPSSSGKMQIEMTYEGDPMLASFLLDGARDHLDEEEHESMPAQRYL